MVRSTSFVAALVGCCVLNDDAEPLLSALDVDSNAAATAAVDAALLDLMSAVAQHGPDGRTMALDALQSNAVQSLLRRAVDKSTTTTSATTTTTTSHASTRDALLTWRRQSSAHAAVECIARGSADAVRCAALTLLGVLVATLSDCVARVQLRIEWHMLGLK